MNFLCFFVGAILQASLANKTLARRLVNSKITSAKEWMVYLKHPELECGGVFYANHMVITCASCNHFEISDWRATTVQFNITTSISEKNSSRYLVSSVLSRTNHPNYNERTNEYDLSIWIVDIPSTGRTIVDLDENSFYKTNITVFKLGWGAINRINAEQDSYDYIYPSELRKVEVPLRSSEDCLKNYKETNNDFYPESMICTGYDYPSKATCYGDAGGPVYTIKHHNRINLIGIMSGTDKCGANYAYDLEVKISNLKITSFIKNQFDLSQAQTSK